MNHRSPPATLNEDVLFEVFRQIGRSIRNSEEGELCDTETTALARCARVCKAFQEPALRVLWEYLPSILPLLRLLAPHFHKLSNGRIGYGASVPHHTYVLSEIPDDVQWARFSRYASYIRVLHEKYSPRKCKHQAQESPDDSDDEGAYAPGRIILPSVWFILSRKAEGKPLLPALRELDWTLHSLDYLELFRVLAGPSLLGLSTRLHDLYIPSREEERIIMPLVVRTLAYSSPNLQKLEVCDEDSLRGVFALSKLRALEIDAPLDTDALQDAKLDTLQHLESLTLSICRFSDDATSRRKPTPLRHLKSLDVRYWDWPSGSQSMVPFSAPTLSSLRVHHSGISRTAAYQSLSTELAECFPTVVSVNLEFSATSTPYEDEHVLPPWDFSRALQPFTALSSVRHFSITNDLDHLPRTSQDLRRIVDAWSYLSTLTVACPSHSKPWLNIGELANLARCATQLRELRLDHLCISQDDLYIIRRGQWITGSLRPTDSVKVLRVDRLVFDRGLGTGDLDLSKLARFVLALYPRIDTRRSRSASPAPHCEWNRALVVIDATRCQQRA
ncbi:hypothetical protein C8Q77DRAFT_1075964 [Trametes polyzona]|nr:hypothetical protein C8Q77DRAFT_1075964 [Trametes polyzona]